MPLGPELCPGYNTEGQVFLTRPSLSFQTLCRTLIKKKSNDFLLSIGSILNNLNKTVTIFIAFSSFPPLNNININNLITTEDHPKTQLKYDIGS